MTQVIMKLSFPHYTELQEQATFSICDHKNLQMLTTHKIHKHFQWQFSSCKIMVSYILMFISANNTQEE
jgi:hypothetical protein